MESTLTEPFLAARRKRLVTAFETISYRFQGDKTYISEGRQIEWLSTGEIFQLAEETANFVHGSRARGMKVADSFPPEGKVMSGLPSCSHCWREGTRG